MSFQHRPDFYRIIMHDKQLRLPKSYVKKYWNGTPNPIFLRLPNGVQQKIFWVERDGGICFDKNWEDFAKFLKVGYFLIFKYICGSYFKVKIFNLSCLEINYSSIRCVDEVGERKEEIKEIIELSDESEEHAQTESGKNGKRKRKVTTQPKNLSRPSPYFEVTLKQSYAEGSMLRIPIAFSREYFTGFEEKAILKVGKDIAMEVLIKFSQGFTMKSGWNKFTQKYNLQVGDACKFVMTQSQPLSFSVTITRVRKKTNPMVSSSDDRIPKRKSIRGTSRGRPKIHVSKECSK
ncbi:unnamed protein product [Lathyrus oleraceus]|uniref:TF-B3 domain-containing protein n=1 Tax=Pisum sativum TaxID=3888 RepID=A0A9D5A6C1_PEA|nr:B3 domain-containing transcription factor VRN1-like isoform X2 [Pisum sativum]KAI5397119.1 hypothetical protein KIW84_063082 [Pisum sativum]